MFWISSKTTKFKSVTAEKYYDRDESTRLGSNTGLGRRHVHLSSGMAHK